MKKIIRTFKQISILFLAITFLGCEEDEAVLPQVVAGFTHTINADTGVVTFINISENATNYSWDFGDETNATIINPVKVYPNGTYTITLKASNIAGASDSFEDEVTISIPNPIALPVTFDDPNVAYDVAIFGGTSFEIVDNPDVSGTNDKASKVGAITNSGAAYEGINFDLGTQIDFTTDKTITMNFWADAAVDVLLKLEQGTGPNIEVTASHGGTGWEMISFDFNSSDKYVRVTLFVDGPGTTAGTFYMDDIEQIETPAATSGCTGTQVAATSLPLDFEGCATFPSSDNFGSGITSELTVNPSKTGINTSDFVLKVEKPTGSDFFAGIQNTFASNFDLTTTNVFKVKVYSTKANAVFRFELALNPQSDPVTGNPAPVFVTIPTAEEWTEVEIAFTGLPGGPTAYNQLVIKPDNDQADSAITAGGTYYLDDLTLSSSTGGSTEPTTAAPTPTRDAGDVISIFSDAYTDVTVDTWRTSWSAADYEEVAIAGNATKKYSNLDFVGVETVVNQVDASSMTHIHVDVWSPDFTDFGLKLVDFGPSGNSEHQVDFASPNQGEWISYDIPLSDFTGLTNTTNIAQYIFVGRPIGASTIFLDNIYFYNEGGSTGGSTEPTTAAPTPTRDAGDVISIFSDAYTDVTVDTWRTSWSAGDYEEVAIAGNATKKYSNLDFVGVETVVNQVDASSMTHIHVDVWSPDFTDFGLKLVDFGPSGNSEHQVDFASPNQGEWISYDIPLSDFTGLTNTTNIAQYIFVGRPIGASTIFLDNIYFYNEGGSTGGSTEPTTAAPTPTRDAGDVISIFSDAYTDVTVDTWRTSWSAGDYEEVAIAGNATKKYSNLDFVGVETVVNQVDASSMTHIHVDVWSPDFTDFGLKLVDFGPSGNSEHQVDFASPNQGEWISYDIPLSDFTGLTNTTNIAQYIFVGRPIGASTIFLDNIYFYDGGSGGGSTCPEPPAGDLISNGDFEAGEGCWQLIQNGGTVTISNTVSSGGGTNSGQIETGPGVNPAVKQERFAVGTYLPNTEYKVTFDIKASTPLTTGAVFKAFTFSEGVDGGTTPATQHILEAGLATVSDSWETKTYTFISAPNADQVEGGISFLAELVCGPAGCAGVINIDNVSITLN